MPLSVGNLLLGTASQPMMSAIASSYASGKQDTLTFGYDTSNKITSIDGSAIVGEGSGDTSQCFPATASAMLQPSGNYLSATESSNYYPSSNPSGFITGVDLTNYATTSYVDSSVSGKLDASASSQFLTSVPEGYATTSYVDSSISGFAYESSVSAWTAKQDALTFGYSGSYISSINGSAIADTTAGGGAGVVTATGGENGYVTSINGSGLSGAGGGGGSGGGDYVPNSATEVAIGSGCTANYTSFAQGVNVSATIGSVAFGSGATASGYSFAANGLSYAETNSVAMANASSAIKTSMAVGLAGASSGSFAQGNGVHASGYSFAQGKKATASATAFAQGDSASAFNQAFAQGQLCSATSYSLSQGMKAYATVNALAQGYSSRSYTASLAQGNYCSASSTSFAQGNRCIASANSFAQGSQVTAINSAVAFGVCNKMGDGDCSTGNSAAFVIGDGTATGARHDLMLVTKDGEVTMYSGTADTAGIPLVATLRALSAWATAQGWTGM